MSFSLFLLKRHLSEFMREIRCIFFVRNPAPQAEVEIFGEKLSDQKTNFIGSGSLLMMLACSFKNERSFYIKNNTIVEGSYEGHGSQANAGIARRIGHRRY